MKQLQERNVDTLKTSMPLCFDKMFPTQGTSGFGLQYNINGIFWKQFKRAGSSTFSWVSALFIEIQICSMHQFSIN